MEAERNSQTKNVPVAVSQLNKVLQNIKGGPCQACSQDLVLLVPTGINSIPRVMISQITIPQSRILDKVPYNNSLTRELAQLLIKVCKV